MALELVKVVALPKAPVTPSITETVPLELRITLSPLAKAPEAVAVKLGDALIVVKLRLPEPSVLSS